MSPPEPSTPGGAVARARLLGRQVASTIYFGDNYD